MPHVLRASSWPLLLLAAASCAAPPAPVEPRRTAGVAPSAPASASAGPSVAPPEGAGASDAAPRVDGGAPEGGADEAGLPGAAAPAPTHEPRGGMVRVEGGELEMGYGTDRMSFHAPPYRATVATFWLDEHEVTVKDYRACVEAKACSSPKRALSLQSCNTRLPGRDDHPVNCIEYDEAEAYCRWAGKRLPTEEEWERAARGSDGRTYPWGEGTSGKRVCWPGWNRGSRPSTCSVTMEVDDVSPYGVRGLAGNVAEWTSSPACGYDKRGCTTWYRITRGGDFKTHAARSYERLGYPAPNQSEVEYGLRCAGDDAPPR